jgi:hypothetical protein
MEGLPLARVRIGRGLLEEDGGSPGGDKSWGRSIFFIISSTSSRELTNLEDFLTLLVSLTLPLPLFAFTLLLALL